MADAVVAILMGSKSDLPNVQPAVDILSEFDVPCDVRVMSAHRTPEIVCDYVSNAKANGVKIIIAAAGGAAHLAGVTAAHTRLPVIGIPVEYGPLQGLDALLATVQMPGGVPVATVSIGKAGAKNAGLLAIRILALESDALADALEAFTVAQKEKVIEADKSLRE